MRRRYHLHFPGIVFCGLILLVGLAAINGQNNLLFVVFAIMFAALVISGVVSGTMMMGLHLRRMDPEPVAAGSLLSIRYEITNRNRLIPIFNVHIEERPVRDPNGWEHAMAMPNAWIMHVGRGESVHGEALVVPEQRGTVLVREVRVWTTFPFGIIKKSITFSLPHGVLIEPRRHRLRPELLRSIEVPQPVGMRVSQHAGGGDDYYGLREFRSEDSVRQIAWRRTASLDQLVSIDRSQPSAPRLRVVLNLTRATADLRLGKKESRTGRELEERAITLAASLLAMADQAGFEIGLTIHGFELPPMPLRRNHRHFRRLMAVLARLDLDQPRLAAPSPTAGRLSERASMVVIHPDRIDEVSDRSDVVHLTGRQLDQLRAAEAKAGGGEDGGGESAAPAKGSWRETVT